MRSALHRLLGILLVVVIASFFSVAIAELNPEDAQILSQLESVLPQSHPDEIHREVARLGDKTLSVKVMFSLFAENKLVRAVLTDTEKYRDWALYDINRKPEGGNFLLQFHDIRIVPPTLNRFDVRFSLDLPFLRGVRGQVVRMSSQKGPGVFTVFANTLNQEKSPISRVDAFLKAFDRGERTWFFGQAQIRLNSAVLYQAFPQKILMREAGDRIQKVIDAFFREKRRRSEIVAGK